MLASTLRLFSNGFLKKTPKIVGLRYGSILAGLRKNPVIVSANNDVYTNLALEHWLYSTLNFTDDEDCKKSTTFQSPVVLIWTDEPTIVIGRHQNPWAEANLNYMQNNGIKLARRHSGGGCVFHDENNINISIIGHRSLFEKRQDNLKFVAQILLDKYGIKCEVTKRHDILHLQTGHKVSGSAAKLGKNNCYHHFTLLIDSNKQTLKSCICPKQPENIVTNSIQSQRSSVINLKEVKPTLEVNQVITDLSNEYSKLYKSSVNETSTHDDDISNDDEFKGLMQIRDQLISWDWVFGMTPKFKLESMIDGQRKQVKLVLHVNKGLVDDVEVIGEIPSTLSDAIRDNYAKLKGTKFNQLAPWFIGEHATQ